MKTKLLVSVLLVALLSGCTPFSGANTKLSIPLGDKMATYSSPKEQMIKAKYVDPSTGKVIEIEITSTQNGDLAAGAAAAASAANQAIAEAASKLIDKAL